MTTVVTPPKTPLQPTPFPPRHVPPTATPLPRRAWQRGMRASTTTLDDFASHLGDYLDTPHVFLASSGRTALRLLLDTLMRQRQGAGRSEVVIPGYTCPAVAKVILDSGLTPRLVDIDPQTFTYPAAALGAAVSEVTLAVVVVHPFGIPVATGPALAAARSVGALVIEDAAQAMGARVDGRHVGSRGHVGLYSLGPGKPMALGGGGVVTTADDALAEALAETWSSLPASSTVASFGAWLRVGLFSVAFQPAMWWLATRLGAQKVGGNEASWGYAHTGLTPAQAAVGLELLPRLDAINRQRRERAMQLLAALAGFSALTTPGIAHNPLAESAKEPIYLRLPLLTQTWAQAESIHRALNAAGVGAGRLYGRTIAEFFPQLDDAPLPGSAQVARTLVTLPTNHHLDAATIAQIPALIRRALTKL